MSALKRVKGLCLAVLCLSSVLALGVAGTASAANTLLFLPHKAKEFPYHLAGLTEKLSTLETVNKEKFTSTAIHVLALVLDKTLVDTHVQFLGVKGEGIAPCSNLGGGGTSGIVLINLLGHLGLSDPGQAPAVLLLVPGGFSFECVFAGVKTNIEVLGSVIALITHPKPLVASELLGIKLEQAAGVQKHTLFLLPNGVVMSDQLLDSAKNGGGFVQFGWETPELLIHALQGEGTFLLVDQ